MIRLKWVLALAVLPLAGCGRGDWSLERPAAAEGVAPNPGAPAGNEPRDADRPVKTRLVRALLQTIDEMQGESPEVKESLRRSLREADAELSQVLGGKSKQLIRQANRKPPALVVGEPDRRPGKPVEENREEAVPEQDEARASNTPTPNRESPAAAPALPRNAPDAPLVDSLIESIDQAPGGSPQAKEVLKKALREARKELETLAPPPVPRRGPASQPVEPDPGDAGAGAPKTRMIQALSQLVDEVEGTDAEIKSELKRTLREADRELNKVLGGKSRSAILRLNNRPPVPVVAEPPSRSVKAVERGTSEGNAKEGTPRETP